MNRKIHGYGAVVIHFIFTKGQHRFYSFKSIIVFNSNSSLEQSFTNNNFNKCLTASMNLLLLILVINELNLNLII